MWICKSGISPKICVLAFKKKLYICYTTQTLDYLTIVTDHIKYCIFWVKIYTFRVQQVLENKMLKGHFNKHYLSNTTGSHPSIKSVSSSCQGSTSVLIGLKTIWKNKALNIRFKKIQALFSLKICADWAQKDKWLIRGTFPTWQAL